MEQFCGDSKLQVIIADIFKLGLCVAKQYLSQNTIKIKYLDLVKTLWNPRELQIVVSGI